MKGEEEIPEESVLAAEELPLRERKERKNRPHLGYMCSQDFRWKETSKEEDSNEA